MDRWGFSGWFSAELPLAWERFLAARGRTLPTCAMFWQMLLREKLLGKGKMSSSPHYNSIYLKLSYQSLSSSNQLQLLYALLFLAGWLFVCWFSGHFCSSADVLLHYRFWSVLCTGHRKITANETKWMV